MAAKELERRGHSIWVCCPDVPHAEKFIRRSQLIHQYPSSIWDGTGKAAFLRTLETLGIDIIIPVSQRMYFPCGAVARKAGVAVVLRLGTGYRLVRLWHLARRHHCEHAKHQTDPVTCVVCAQ